MRPTSARVLALGLGTVLACLTLPVVARVYL